MAVLLWDASSLAKRYTAELGSDTVDALFSLVPVQRMIGTFVGYAESYSVILRARNRGDITEATAKATRSALRIEILEDPDFRLLAVDEADILAGIELMDRHLINSSDASLLAAFLRLNRTSSNTNRRILVAADRRLLRAAAAEGLQVLNPETVSPADVESQLT